MANTTARFRVVDIQRILQAAKNADVPVRVEIEGQKITVENLPDYTQKTVEPEGKIVL